MVSVLAFYSNHLSSNPAKVYIFLYLKRTITINKRGRGSAFFKNTLKKIGKHSTRKVLLWNVSLSNSFANSTITFFEKAFQRQRCYWVLSFFTVNEMGFKPTTKTEGDRPTTSQLPRPTYPMSNQSFLFQWWRLRGPWLLLKRTEGHLLFSINKY